MDTKERIIETACRLFYSQGYNSTGINQIIEEAEVAKASLYQYFPAKEDLLAEYLKIAGEEINNMLRSAVARQETPKDKILAIFDLLIKRVKQPDFNGCDFLNIASEISKNNKTLRTIIKNQKDGIRDLFTEILKPIGKKDLSDELYVLFDGAFVTSKVYHDVWPVKMAKRVVDKLL
jgi:AcrR family transcriptional regulator